MAPWCKKTEDVENIGSGKALTACQLGWCHQIWTGSLLDTPFEMHFGAYDPSVVSIDGGELLYTLPPLCRGLPPLMEGTPTLLYPVAPSSLTHMVAIGFILWPTLKMLHF